jgi:polyphosphate kinase 2 (PPK2 family)
MPRKVDEEKGDELSFELVRMQYWIKATGEKAVILFERMLVRSGIILLKYWFSVSDEELERRFAERAGNPARRWKLSPTWARTSAIRGNACSSPYSTRSAISLRIT